MLQTIDNKTVYVVEFDTLPELPITGLTPEEKAYNDFVYLASYPHGPQGTLAALSTSPTYAEILTDAIQTGVITEPGKYGLYRKPGTREYEIYTINE